jgi:hypothetical protein
MRLKKSCIVAAEKARRNWSGRRRLPSDASVLVTVVPMLAPMIIGTAKPTGSVPAPTSPTMVAVDTEEDCTSTVARIPANRPARGLETLSSSPSWKPSPMAAMPDSSRATPTRKPYRATTTIVARATGGRGRREADSAEESLVTERLSGRGAARSLARQVGSDKSADTTGGRDRVAPSCGVLGNPRTVPSGPRRTFMRVLDDMTPCGDGPSRAGPDPDRCQERCPAGFHRVVQQLPT